MLKLADKNLSVYKGDYRPVKILKNGQKISSFKEVGMSGEEATFQNTYNAPITVYGKGGYLKGKNLCPPPENMSDTFDELASWQISVQGDGRFDVEGAMLTGITTASVILKAGTYTASGCELVQLWWEESDGFVTLPATFTLEKETEVLTVLWYSLYTNISLKNQYIQIEKGETATDYSPFVGNLDFAPSTQNVCKLAGSSGELKVESGNLLPPDFGEFTQWKLDENSSISNSRFFELDLSPGEYRLTFDIIETPGNNNYGYLYLSESNDDWQTNKSYPQPIQASNCNNAYKFTAKEGFKYRFWYWRSTPRPNFFDNWQLQKCDIPDGKYMYFPSYKTEISLKGIEVTEVDNYNYFEASGDENRYYLSDSIRGDVLEKRIGSVKITGQEEFYQKQIENNNFCCYYCDLSNVISQNRNADKFLCNCFEALTGLNTEKEGAVLGDNDTNLYFLVRKNRFSTTQKFKAWLQNMHQNGSSAELYFLLDDDKIEALNLDVPIKSFPDFTRIYNRTNAAALPLGLEKCIKIEEK